MVLGLADLVMPMSVHLRRLCSVTPQPTQKSPIVPLVDLHGRSAWSILPPLILGFFMIMVDTTIVNIAVPTLVKELDADLVSVGWVNRLFTVEGVVAT